MAVGQDGPKTVNLKIKPEDADQALLEAPVIFIDGAQGMAYTEHLVKLNLFQDRLVAVGDKPIERVICARLVIPRNVFHSILKWMAQNGPPQATPPPAPPVGRQ